MGGDQVVRIRFGGLPNLTTFSNGDGDTYHSTPQCRRRRFLLSHSRGVLVRDTRNASREVALSARPQPVTLARSRRTRTRLDCMCVGVDASKCVATRAGDWQCWVDERLRLTWGRNSKPRSLHFTPHVKIASSGSPFRILLLLIWSIVLSVEVVGFSESHSHRSGVYSQETEKEIDAPQPPCPRL